MPASLPYGSWPSPLSTAEIASGAKRLSGLAQRNGQLWWAESRPEEKGRVALVRSVEGAEPADVLESPWSARSMVHEYGGGAWWLGAENAYFVNAADQQIYALAGSLAGAGNDVRPQPLTAGPDDELTVRYADGREHLGTGALAVVRETHPQHGNGGKVDHAAHEPTNEIVVVAGLAGGGELAAPHVVASGADFYSAPRFSPDGNYLSWIQWNHPQMPWDGTELYVAPVLVDGNPALPLTIGAPSLVAGGSDTAIVGADWMSAGQLLYSTDSSGFWNLEHYDPSVEAATVVTALIDADIGAPPWSFGTQQWVELSNGDIAVVVTRAARDGLAVLPASQVAKGGADWQDFALLDSGWVRIDAMAPGGGGDLVFTGSGVGASAEIASVNASSSSSASARTVYQPTGELLADGWVSAAQSLEFVSGDGRAHAFFYPPTGARDGSAIVGPEGELPPLIVMGHGGPTAHSSPAFGLKVQYWTSRGFAVADVNYRGSTGFGRDYRRLLNRNWGIVDVEDCIAVARHAADQGLVDPERIAIRGGSAGGFTVLRALQESDVFSAGTSLYGVADLEALASDTHKFESRYLDGLIGPYPQRRDIYAERSPINHTESLSCPLLVLQGTEDKVVPPSQSEAIVAAVAAKGLPHAYITFEGEQHGFRQAASIVRSLEAELWFYSQVFGFEPADALPAPTEAVGFS